MASKVRSILFSFDADVIYLWFYQMSSVDGNIEILLHLHDFTHSCCIHRSEHSFNKQFNLSPVKAITAVFDEVRGLKLN